MAAKSSRLLGGIKECKAHYIKFLQTLEIWARPMKSLSLGNMNAYTEDLDGYTGITGNVLLDLCEEHDLV